MSTLRELAVAPCRHYDVALLDLDGVVYVGSDAVPGAAAALAQARQAGMRLAFVTNNASRTPAAVASTLTRLEVPAEAGDVITSAQAAAHHLADRLPAGSPVLVVGTTGLVEALQERGLRPVSTAAEQPQAVVQGFSPAMDWALLCEAVVAVRSGVPFVATNLDATIPSPRGPLPGNGALVGVVAATSGVRPTSTGKPDPTMHRESVERSGATRPLVVGDRLDTDIEGARAVGCDSMLVLSGVTDAAAALTARPQHRPDLVAADVAGLLDAHPGPTQDEGLVRCGLWQVGHAGAALRLARVPRSGGADEAPPAASGALSGSELDALRALCVAAWSAAGDGTHGGRCRAGDDDAARVLARLGLSA